MTTTNRESAAPLPSHLAKYPTPFHVFHEALLLEDAKALKEGILSALPGAEFYYSAKTNSLLALLRCLLGEKWNIETVCPADRRQALLAGAKGAQLMLNGAAWTKDELEDALFGQRIQHLTIDSLPMAELLGATLKENPGKASGLRLALRIHDGNSHFGFHPDPATFLQALSAIPAVAVKSIGLHLHSNPSASIRSLAETAADFTARTEKLIAAANQVNAVSTKLPVSFFDLGGGFDTPYVYRPHPAELAEFHDPKKAEKFRERNEARAFDMGEIAKAAAGAVAKALGKERAGQLKIYFEPGRSVCARSLSTVVEVRAVKKKFYPEGDVVITDGNTALLGPLHRGLYPIRADKESKDKLPTFLYGNLPHSGDWLYQSVPLPELNAGDRLVISHTGAYFLPLEANFGLPRPGIYHAQRDLILRAPETELDPGIRDTV